ncbi:hypothetical protein SAMN02982917_6994 [Azospirillum oryzae]|uniref:Uncharacterized protein n=1 Tax=Azospirillum oryzae TaxID=286727 RepID=A0A1X7HQZ0_9PROT|nr:hypothetical protein [Azospirillum oryzae]SMF90183.1 hypothetical protein SAMN02982917_6994 [Azospirillum oryzae]
MTCMGIGVIVTTFYVFVLAAIERGFGIPPRSETMPSAVPKRRPSGEERMG